MVGFCISLARLPVVGFCWALARFATLGSYIVMATLCFHYRQQSAGSPRSIAERLRCHQ